MSVSLVFAVSAGMWFAVALITFRDRDADRGFVYGLVGVLMLVFAFGTK